jgi:hypothetical protein
VVDAANQQLPYSFRLKQDGADWTFVPVPALLDRHVTIPPGRRRVIEHVRLLTEALSAQTGFDVGCCQGAVAGAAAADLRRPAGITICNGAVP